MTTLKRIYSFLFFCLTAGITFSQSADSLKLALKNTKHDTTRCNILNEMIDAENMDAVWSVYNQQLLGLAELNLKKIPASDPLYKKYLIYKCIALNNAGYLAQNNGDLTKALEYLNASLTIEESIKDEEGMAANFNNMASIYKDKGDIPSALEYNNKALKIHERKGNKAHSAISYNNIGLIYYAQEDLKSALQYFNKSLKLHEETNDRQGISTTLNNIGMVYDKQNNISKALEYYRRALDISKANGNKLSMASSLNHIGLVYDNDGNLSEAIKYYDESLKLYEENSDKEGLVLVITNMGYIYFKQKDYSRSFDHALRAMQIAKELGYPVQISYAADLLNKIYKIKKDYKKALEYYVLYTAMNDSINNAATKKAAIRSQFKYLYEKKALQDSTKNAEQIVKENIKHEESIRQQKIYASGGGIGFGLMLIITVISLRAYRNKRKANNIIQEQKQLMEEQKNLVEEKQKEILDSIYYARRIQRALITSETHIQNKINKLRVKG